MNIEVKLLKPVEFFRECSFEKFVIYLEIELVPKSFLSLSPYEKYTQFNEISKTKFFYLPVQVDSKPSDIEGFCRFKLLPFSKTLSVPSGYVPICYGYFSFLGGPEGYENKDLKEVMEKFDKNKIQITFNGKPIPDMIDMLYQFWQQMTPEERRKLKD